MPAISGTCVPGSPLDTQPGGQLVSEHSLEHLTGGTDVPVEVGVRERRPLAVVPSTRFATSTCQCNNGSPARDVRCRNDAATTPEVGSRRSGRGLARRAGRGLRATPGCATRAAPGSLHAPASRSPRASPPRRLRSRAPCTRGSSDTAYSTLADLGALNVRSKPGTRRGCGRHLSPFGVSPPVPGRSPASTARRSSGSTGAVQTEAGGTAADPHAVRLTGAGVVVVERLRRRRTGGRPPGRHGAWRSTAHPCTGESGAPTG